MLRVVLLLSALHTCSGVGAENSAGAPVESCDADLDGGKFARSYTLTGCSDPSQCGVYRRTEARCLKDYTEGGLCGSDPTLCDQAPVYQLEGRKEGPVLYRWSPYGRSSEWRVGPSARLADCEGYSALLRSPAAAGRPSPGAPTDPEFDDDAGWYDAARRKPDGTLSSPGKVTISAGGS